MKRSVCTLIWVPALLAFAAPAISHDCRVRDRYLRGEYHGDCDERTEMAHGNGEARGAAMYVGAFVKGYVDGKGVYTWEDGARLDGNFRNGKAEGAGVYVSAKGVRYEGLFASGRLEGLTAPDCPSTPGPLTC